MKFKVEDHVYHWALGKGKILKSKDGKLLCWFGGDTYEWLNEGEILNDK